MTGAPGASRYGTPRDPVGGARWDVRRLAGPNRLWGSNGVTFGPDGRLYVAQFLAGVISAVDLASGEVDTVVPAGGPIQSPDDLAFGPDGSLYVTDLVPGRVWRRSPEGEYALVADDVVLPNGIAVVGDRLFVNEMRPGGRLLELFPAGGAPVVLADDLAMGNAMQLGPDGCLYYPHMLSGEVFRVPVDGGGPELVAEDVDHPVAVRFDPAGDLLVLSMGAAGVVTRVSGWGAGERSVVPSGIVGLDNAAFDGEGRMYVSSYASGGIAELRPDGRSREIVPRGLDGPFGVTVDLGGRVHLGDHYRLASVEDEGAVTTRELLPFTHGLTCDARGLLHLTSEFGELRTHDPATGSSRTRVEGLDAPVGLAARADGAVLVAESGRGRVVVIDERDTVAVLVSGLERPVDVAVDGRGHCYVTDEATGVLHRVDDGVAVPVAEGLDLPQGLAVRGDDLLVVEVGRRRLIAVDPDTGEVAVEVADLAVGAPPGSARTPPALAAAGMPGVPRPFAGLAVGPDGAVYLAANGEGGVLKLVAR
ncbi:NHL repeat protein [Actinoalloteichus caeruleus]|uniref:Sugar lactone lactonase YvrE n=1 Tax=Actinoalloteichus caeruleus DSM 43889 TaxID=1120930 RepID=A0ABT1JCN4_ACTCY|nr:NHL repeat protein [Actinoalloteichus caeruleus]MCP2330198.1 Sugar lactone lactonase YvrE [Actinoalloteichus caeruleus DSM 43889]